MESSQNPLPQGETGLFADLYELTMGQAFFHRKMFAPATFSLFVRNYPPNRGYLVSAGLEDVLDYLAGFQFSQADLTYLQSTGIFAGDFLDYLEGLRFTGSVRAIPEGRLYFANEPVLEVTGPIIEAQMVETFIINQVNLQTLLATKAARCVWAAQGRGVSDFSARRAQGTDAALKMARCSYIGGFQSTSNVLAAQRYGIPPAGTMAHSFVSSFHDEAEAFRAYADTFPERTILLLDTYDTIEGAWTAVQVAKELEESGNRLLGVRLDSGDFASLSRQVRRILDEADLDYVKILASGGLDEFEVDRLVRDEAPIDVFGVGTKAGVSADAPWSDMAYKLVCYDGRPVMKLSPDKVNPPGAKQVFRLRDSGDTWYHDILGLSDETVTGAEEMLVEVMAGGSRTAAKPSLLEIRERHEADMERLDPRFKGLHRPPLYPVQFSPKLQALTARVQQQLIEPN